MNIKYLIRLIIFISLFALSNTGFTASIVGGQVATVGRWPAMIALVRNNLSTLKPLSPFAGQFCGATLIAPTWVITAAHCVYGKSNKEFSAVAHLFDLRNDKGEAIAIKRIIRHPNYNDITMVNDIALLQLKSAVTAPQVLPIISSNTLLVNVKAVIIGWGVLSENAISYPSKLYQAFVPIVSNAACNKSYQGQITNNMLCAGFSTGGVDACQGDSGGPLMVAQNGKWVLAGITSFGEGCALPNYYGVYTRVANYNNFIKSTLETVQ